MSSSSTKICTQDGKFRQQKVSYSSVSNTALRDKNLSIKAKGLYGIIASYMTLVNNDPDYELYKRTLIDESTDGIRSFTTAWNELKDKGYLKQYRIRKAEGFEYEYDLLAEPDSNTPGTINIKMDGSISESETLTKKIDLDIEYEDDFENEKAIKEHISKEQNTVNKKILLSDIFNDKQISIPRTNIDKQKLTELVKEQIRYDEFKYPPGTGTDCYIDDITRVIVETLSLPDDGQSILKIRKRDTRLTNVKSILSKIEYKHIESVIQGIDDYIEDGKVINDVYSFILASLYNAYFEYNTKSYQNNGMICYEEST